MRKTIFNKLILGLLALLLFFFFSCAYLLRPSSVNRDNVAGFYAEEPDSLDMVYVGGSACYNYWEPLRAWRNAGFTSYNFATSGITPQAVKRFIIEIRKTQRPELYVVDMRPFQYGDKLWRDKSALTMYADIPVRYTTDSLSYSANRFALVNESVPDPGMRLSYHFDSLKYNVEFPSVLGEIYQAVRSGDYAALDYADNIRSNPEKGFSAILDHNEFGYTDLTAVTGEDRPSEELHAILLDLLDYCKTNELRVLFLIHAYVQEEESKMRYNYIGRIVEEYGFDYLNVNDRIEETGLDFSTDFSDAGHTNLLGADKYTDYLTGYISEHYHLPDHRGEARYAQWDVLAQAFESRCAESRAAILEAIASESDGDQ